MEIISINIVIGILILFSIAHVLISFVSTLHIFNCKYFNLKSKFIHLLFVWLLPIYGTIKLSKIINKFAAEEQYGLGYEMNMLVDSVDAMDGNIDFL